MKADWLDLSANRILSLTNSDPQNQGEPPRGGAGSSFGDNNQERRQHQEIKPKDQNKPAHYDTPDTEQGGGSADDDTSAGYGLGGSTGNSSDPSTGLSPIDND